MHLLYPSNPLRARQPDDQFSAEVGAVRDAGFAVSVFSMENFQAGEFHPIPELPSGAEVLYRGWMMSTSEYESLASILAQFKAHPFTSLLNYLASHHLPNWYPRISDLTPETRIFPPDCNLESELRALAWPEYFIKDYVKSLKTSVGSRITRPEEAAAVVADMQRFRGVIEGGFCIRRVESFITDTERRYFVLNGVACSADGRIPGIVRECAKRFESRFYSVDVVQRIDGQLRIVEVGDGQVSDLVGWRPEQFAKLLAENFGDGYKPPR
jgi:hypothetical protein